MTLRFTPKEFAARLAENPQLGIKPGNFEVPKAEAEKPETKYRARRTDGYASAKEARYAGELALRQKCGEVLFWLEQVPFRLPGGVKYRADFVVFLMGGGYQVVDVKGFRTPMYKAKKRLVEALYPIKITEV